MENAFESPFRGRLLSEQVTNPNIVVGRYSYYSGYYHGHAFDDCARFLSREPGTDRLIVGSFCSIGSGAVFMMAGNQGHRNDWISTFPFFYMRDEEPAFAAALDAYRPAGDTVIGSDVWIGSEAMFMPGVTVGHGAVIGSRALVTRDVEPYAVVGGTPARSIRRRFPDEQVAMLLEMAWWDWPLDSLRDAMPLLCAGDVPALHRFWQASRRP